MGLLVLLLLAFNSTSSRPGSIFREQDCGNGMINGLSKA